MFGLTGGVRGQSAGAVLFWAGGDGGGVDSFFFWRRMSEM